jgi:hypothetical protein
VPSFFTVHLRTEGRPSVQLCFYVTKGKSPLCLGTQGAPCGVLTAPRPEHRVCHWGEGEQGTPISLASHSVIRGLKPNKKEWAKGHEAGLRREGTERIPGHTLPPAHAKSFCPGEKLSSEGGRTGVLITPALCQFWSRSSSPQRENRAGSRHHGDPLSPSPQRACPLAGAPARR